MAHNHKVLWFEGMTLDPHHFQQWDRFHQSVVNTKLGYISGFGWGIAGMSIESEGIANGRFNLQSCQGITPDGLSFSIPENDAPIAPRSFQEFFPATAQQLGVYLAVPVERAGSANISLQESDATRENRFIAHEELLNDDNTGSSERQIRLAHANLQIRFDGEPLESFSTIKIAEVGRASDGSFALSSNFVPPALTISASQNLVNLSKRILELLVAKSNALSQKWQHTSVQTFTMSDLKSYEMLQTVNAFIPLMNHHYALGKSHPEAVYQTLLSMAGQLVSLTDDATVSPGNFPLYDHSQPTECFSQMDSIVRSVLGQTVAANYISIPLQKRNESTYIGQVTDSGLLQQGQFYLIVSGDFPETKIVSELPMKIRIASPESIDAVLRSLTRALMVKHLSQPVAGVPNKPGTYHFKLEQQGPFWDAICQSSSMAIFIPGEFAGLHLELIAVK